jgi:hypothetical protein
LYGRSIIQWSNLKFVEALDLDRNRTLNTLLTASIAVSNSEPNILSCRFFSFCQALHYLVFGYVCHQATDVLLGWLFWFQFFIGMIVWFDLHLWHRINSVWFGNPGEDQSDFGFFSWWVRMVAQVAICITYITCVLWFDLHPLFYAGGLNQELYIWPILLWAIKDMVCVHFHIFLERHVSRLPR